MTAVSTPAPFASSVIEELRRAKQLMALYEAELQERRAELMDEYARVVDRLRNAWRTR